jgi:hypothetical protein
VEKFVLICISNKFFMLPIIDIPIQQGQWLTDALQAQGYTNIPTNIIYSSQSIKLYSNGRTHNFIFFT